MSGPGGCASAGALVAKAARGIASRGFGALATSSIDGHSTLRFRRSVHSPMPSAFPREKTACIGSVAGCSKEKLRLWPSRHSRCGSQHSDSNAHLALSQVALSKARHQIARAVVFCWKPPKDLIGTLRCIEARRSLDEDLLADFVSIVGHVT
jgi:hypothetical protein